MVAFGLALACANEASDSIVPSSSTDGDTGVTSSSRAETSVPEASEGETRSSLSAGPTTDSETATRGTSTPVTDPTLSSGSDDVSSTTGAETEPTSGMPGTTGAGAEMEPTDSSVSESGTSECASADDCRMVNDCCTCSAVPEDEASPVCGSFCGPTACDAIGLERLAVVCELGTCVLSLVCNDATLVGDPPVCP